VLFALFVVKAGDGSDESIGVCSDGLVAFVRWWWKRAEGYEHVWNGGHLLLHGSHFTIGLVCWPEDLVLVSDVVGSLWGLC